MKKKRIILPVEEFHKIINNGKYRSVDTKMNWLTESLCMIHFNTTLKHHIICMLIDK